MKRLLETRFTETGCYRLLEESHIGFVDIGAAGGVPSEITPISGITDVLYFEPDGLEFERISRSGREAGFGRMVGVQNILADSSGPRTLNVTRSGVNSSLLTPNKRFCDRYGLRGFDILKSVEFEAVTLDDCIAGAGAFVPDIIKIDCQGADLSILEVSHKALDDAVCVFSEMIVAGMYDGQNSIADIHRLLEDKGFRLYGLWPHYISGRKLDRTRFETNERLLYVDGLYLKDPLVETGTVPQLSERSLSALFVVACQYHYYDYAIELAENFFGSEVEVLRECVMALASARKEWVEGEAGRHAGALGAAANPYLLTKKLVDTLKDNNDVAFLPDPE